MYLTTDPQGRELCLRPDLTIPVSRDYLASPSAGTPQGFCYLGPVFQASKSEFPTSDIRKVLGRRRSE
jgi:ATP phosphoribosyltransferase regulatory subunit HisZ